jgi:hypothetical protein
MRKVPGRPSRVEGRKRETAVEPASLGILVPNARPLKFEAVKCSKGVPRAGGDVEVVGLRTESEGGFRAVAGAPASKAILVPNW